MKLIIQANRIAATATDAYTGPDEYIAAPPDFDASRMGEYACVDGVLVAPPPVTQFTLDQARYSKRAAVKDALIAYMAADNMSRVRSGQWTVAELTGLMTDPDVSAATSYMGTLSYELAAQAIAQATTTLLTPEIKAAWVAKLQEHFYLTP